MAEIGGVGSAKIYSAHIIGHKHIWIYRAKMKMVISNIHANNTRMSKIDSALF